MEYQPSEQTINSNVDPSGQAERRDGKPQEKE